MMGKFEVIAWALFIVSEILGMIPSDKIKSSSVVQLFINIARRLVAGKTLEPKV
jgi:hypothetical protein